MGNTNGSFFSGMAQGATNTFNTMLQFKRFKQDEEQWNRQKKLLDEQQKDRELQREILQTEKDNIKAQQQFAAADGYYKMGDYESAAHNMREAYKLIPDGHSIGKIIDLDNIPGDALVDGDPGASGKYIEAIDPGGNIRYKPLEELNKYIENGRNMADPKNFFAIKDKAKATYLARKADVESRPWEFAKKVKIDGKEYMSQADPQPDGTIKQKKYTIEEWNNSVGELLKTPEQELAFRRLKAETEKAEKNNLNDTSGMQKRIAELNLATAKAKRDKALGDAGYSKEEIKSAREQAQKEISEAFKDKETGRYLVKMGGKQTEMSPEQIKQATDERYFELLRGFNPKALDTYQKNYQASFNPGKPVETLPGSGLPLQLSGQGGQQGSSQSMFNQNRRPIDPRALVSNIQNNLKGGSQQPQQPLGPADPRGGAEAAIEMKRQAQMAAQRGETGVNLGGLPPRQPVAPTPQNTIFPQGPGGQPSPNQNFWMDQAKRGTFTNSNERALQNSIYKPQDIPRDLSIIDPLRNLGNASYPENFKDPMFGEAQVSDNNIKSIMYALRKAGIGGKDLSQKRFLAQKIKSRFPDMEDKDVADFIIRSAEEEKHPTERSVYSQGFGR